MAAVDLPDVLRTPIDDARDEPPLIDDLQQWLSRETTHVQALVDSLASLEPVYRRRGLQALGRLVKRSELTLSDLSVGDDPDVVYHLLDEGFSGSRTEHREILEGFARHEVSWVSAKALEKLAESPSENESIIRERLSDESREPVLIALLKSLYVHSSISFEPETIDLIDPENRPQATFYAGVLLKKTDPDRFGQQAEDLPYLRELSEQVRIEPPGCGDARA